MFYKYIKIIFNFHGIYFIDKLLFNRTKLENAIYIYKKYGFVEIPVKKESPYARCDIKMELKLK